MSFRSILKPEHSVTAGLATVGIVLAEYQLNVGGVADAQATAANHSTLNTSKRKAGYTALVMVAGITLITKDANILILGGAAIIAMELAYRHAIMAHPESGAMQNPSPETTYMPAQNVIPMYAQGQTA